MYGLECSRSLHVFRVFIRCDGEGRVELAED